MSFVPELEVRKVPNSPDGEYFFAALPNGAYEYTHEVDKNLPKPQYSKNAFAVNVSNGFTVRAATQQEWESGSRISRPRLVFNLAPDDATGELKVRHRRYAKVGKYWGHGLLSPTGKWLAVFSYTGVKRQSGFILGGGDAPRDGDAFWQVYDAVTGKKVFEWEAKNVKHPASLNGPVVWLDDRYFLFPENEEAQNFNVVTLPPVTAEVNPVTLQLPSRRDVAGVPLPAGDRDEVWVPLVPLTKEQAEKLTAPIDTQIAEVRMSATEILVAIKEETENRRANRQQRDGAGDYQYRVISTYYYAVSLENPTQTRMITKEEFEKGRTTRGDRPRVVPGPLGETVAGPLPPHRQFRKTGVEWGSHQLLSAGEWIAVFSYGPSEIFVDVYDQRMGDKLMTTALAATVSPNELFKSALWVEGGYILMPLNASFDSFALWQLPN